MSNKYDHNNVFLYLGGGAIIASLYGFMVGVFNGADVFVALFCAYTVLRLTNAMSRADKNSKSR